ncbi:8-oxo-dGTP diphosphatase [Rhodococcus sp. 27YEA15]|uniref:(deoxy)nucleoside triphosphate pyrophosphohydrolase n=1 Tax=Rhodococcus sp. 27YEA15 TaxID=3156259 RepID=UPI003C7A03EF
MSEISATPREVVAGALLRDGTLLLAQRARPPELAGQWELPGGKVEPSENPAEALARELQEELGVQVRVGDRIGSDVRLSEDLVLRAYRVELLAGEPTAIEHARLDWVTAEGLLEIDLVVNDRAWVPELLAALRESAESS